MNDYLNRSLEIIAERGHMVQGVIPVEEGDHGFTYTVGLSARGWPEIVMVCPDMQPAAKLINDIVDYYDGAGREPVAGDEVTLAEGCMPIRLRACSIDAPGYPLNTARAFYDDDVRALQAVLPDPLGHYPGDPENIWDWQELVP
jgi:hypothetical protein